MARPIRTGPESAEPSTTAKSGAGAADDAAAEEGTQRAQPYERATDLGIAHRPVLTRDELQQAPEKAGRGRHLRSAS